MNITQSTVIPLFSRNPKRHPFDFWRCWQLLAVLLCSGVLATASAQTFTNLHSFAAIVSDYPHTNSDGHTPTASLILSGNTLYGTASDGGSFGKGTVFKINIDGTGFTNLHIFTATADTFPDGNGDGASPAASLILSGNTLYGTASIGGSSGNGTVFAVNTDGSGFTNLHSFTAFTDGANPNCNLILSGNTLYGTASQGGGANNGAVFAVNTDGTGFKNLHNFTALIGSFPFPSTNSDGAAPYAGLVLSGNTLYGTAFRGGSSDKGVVFAVNIDGSGFTNLHSFISDSGGANPRAGLVLSDSTLYGTTSGGYGLSFCGVVFGVGINGTDFTNVYSLGYDEGNQVLASLILSGSTLYGTAYLGGSAGHNNAGGTVFAVNTDGANFTNLYSFTVPQSDFLAHYTNSEGSSPAAGLILSGNSLYGTASHGGSAGSGTSFSLSLPALPNQLPIVANLIPDQSGNYGSVFNLTFPADIFNDPDVGQTLTYTVSNLPPGITFDGPTRVFSGTNTTVGVYAVTVTATDNGTPNLSTNTTFQFVVNKASLTITADNTARPYGGYAFYSLNFSGFVLDEQWWNLNFNPFADSLADYASPVGTYPITVSGGTDSHYEITLVSGTLTVTNALLRAEAASVSRGVGQSNPPLFGILRGGVDPDNITASYMSGATPVSLAGTYPIVPVLNNPDGRLTNYTVTLVNGTLTVESDAVYPDFEVLHRFGFTNQIGGISSEMIEGADGWLYGVGGGVNGMGVFRIQKDGTGFIVMRTFTVAEGAPAGRFWWTPTVCSMVAAVPSGA